MNNNGSDRHLTEVEGLLGFFQGNFHRGQVGRMACVDDSSASFLSRQAKPTRWWRSPTIFLQAAPGISSPSLPSTIIDRKTTEPLTRLGVKATPGVSVQ
jgi:hypothetical protein